MFPQVCFTVMSKKRVYAQAEMPELLTVSQSPHIKRGETTRTIMLDVIVALLPALFWGAYVFGLRALSVVLVSVASCVIFEVLFEVITKRPITIMDFSAVVSGILLGFNLPASVPLWMPIVGGAFAMIVVKGLFGGIGKNFVNPVLAARVFLFSWTDLMTVFSKPFEALPIFKFSLDSADIVASATPLAAMKNGIMPSETMTDMVLGIKGGCIGEISGLMILIGGIYLIIRRVISWHIPVAYIGTVAALTYFFPMAGEYAHEFLVYQMFSGGLLLGAVFMATDYVTSPMTELGKLIFGVGCGAITVFIRYFGGYPEGVSFAVLIMNLLVNYIDKATIPKRFGGVPKNAGTK